jgi:DNA-binding MarR family transcriptional regulator
VRPELTERQSAVLEALRAKAGDDNLVEIKGADLAEAASIPLGSVHSVIQSLEKKKCILTARPGSSHAPAVYQVLSPAFASRDPLPTSLQ